MLQNGLKSALAVACLLALGLAQPSFAAEEDQEYPFPHFQPPCTAECADFQPATPILHVQPEYRSDLLGNTPSYAPEGFALLRYTVGTDGKTHDITPIIRLGHHRIAEQAIESIRAWTFTPATRNGKPVAQMLTYRIYIQPDYTKRTASFGPHLSWEPRSLVNWGEVNRLIGAGKREEARAMLKEVLARPSDYGRQPLYERLIKLATERGDYLEARQYAVTATASYEADGYRIEGWTARLNADLALGELADAGFSYLKVKKLGLVAGVDVRFREAFAKADAAPELLVRAAISSDYAAPVYWHALHRNTFKFAEGTGALDKFSLMCDNNMLEGQVSFTAQWRLPATWRNCILFVSGAPGATFGVIETNGG